MRVDQRQTTVIEPHHGDHNGNAGENGEQGALLLFGSIKLVEILIEEGRLIGRFRKEFFPIDGRAMVYAIANIVLKISKRPQDLSCREQLNNLQAHQIQLI